jgi:hypothetical protein
MSNAHLPQEIAINFVDANQDREVGRFWFDRKTLKWHFGGDMDRSAELFAQYLYSHFADILEAEHGIIRGQDDKRDH